MAYTNPCGRSNGPQYVFLRDSHLFNAPKPSEHPNLNTIQCVENVAQQAIDVQNPTGHIFNPWKKIFYLQGFENGEFERHWLYTDGTEFIGKLVYGLREGRGTMVWPNGDQYEGMWKNGQRHGQGQYTQYGFSVYIGEWENDVPQGKAKINYNEVTGLTIRSYEGDVINGLPHGVGVMKFADGTVYKGPLVAGRPQGIGTIIQCDGETELTIYWDKGLKDGRGTLIRKGECYTLYFIKDRNVNATTYNTEVKKRKAAEASALLNGSPGFDAS